MRLAEIHAAEERGGALGRHEVAARAPRGAGGRGRPAGGAGGRACSREEEEDGGTDADGHLDSESLFEWTCVWRSPSLLQHLCCRMQQGGDYNVLVHDKPRAPSRADPRPVRCHSLFTCLACRAPAGTAQLRLVTLFMPKNVDSFSNKPLSPKTLSPNATLSSNSEPKRDVTSPRAALIPVIVRGRLTHSGGRQRHRLHPHAAHPGLGFG